MKSKLVSVFSLLTIVALVITASRPAPTYDAKREKLLMDLHNAIREAEEQGEYECCIKPACTMCYLGDWIWEDGSCLCDEMIAQGQDDKVCPQCKKGLEKGLCESASNTECDPSKIFRPMS